MSTALAYARLIQTKRVYGTVPNMKFCVHESVTNAVGPLVAPFKITSGVGELMQVAAYEDVASTTTLLLNKLTRFDGTTSFAGLAVPGDLLRITNMPEWWGVEGADPVWEVASVDSTDLIVTTPFPAVSDVPLSWTLHRGGALLLSGSLSGTVKRASLANPVSLDTEFLSVFATATEALAHITYTQTMFAALTAQIKQAAAEYLQSAPGNPITSTFSA